MLLALYHAVDLSTRMDYNGYTLQLYPLLLKNFRKLKTRALSTLLFQ
jgi:hypothetical protein